MVLGSGGMLGHDLVATVPRDVALIALSRAQLDITDRTALKERVNNTRPDIIINAAAYTAVDQAETDPERAFLVNSEAVEAIGHAAARIGARVVHFSTDYVFDGTAPKPYSEDATPRPINIYGASKLAGERLLAQTGAHLVIRTQWLFGQHGSSFPRKMFERAREGVSTKVVSDQFGRPTYTKDLALATWSLVSFGALGVLHVANEGTATWFDLAYHIFAAIGVGRLVAPCKTAEYPVPAKRPAASVLDTSRFKSLLNTSLPTWSDAVQRFLETLRKEPALATRETQRASEHPRR